MKQRALAIPEYVANLTHMQLTLIGLQPIMQDDMIICPLMYEDGSGLSLVTMCIAKRGWFRKTPMLIVSIVELAENTRVVQVYLQQTMAVPVDDNDVPFLLRYGSMIKAMLVTHAKVSNMGKLVNLRRREAK
ncbi:hypothetical protein [Bradyrhizobium sp. LA2.1]|uniref:hypothetical protein n=1 Tax=Bradyrhizobium sp. LA2.1 TaxID=3156376 RepID=UPI0033909B15